MLFMKNKVPKPIINLGILLLILIGMCLASEISSNISTKGREPNDIGYVAFHKGTIYFVKGGNIKTSDLENFSDDDVMYSKKFEEISILINAEIKLTTKGIKSGDKVAIWYEEVLESYPAQIKLIQIKKVD